MDESSNTPHLWAIMLHSFCKVEFLRLAFLGGLDVERTSVPYARASIFCGNLS